MALKPNARMDFARYEIERDGVTLWFVCPDPGPGEPSDYYAYITRAQLATVTNEQTFAALVLAELKRVYRADGVASRLDSLLGRSITLP